MNVTQTRIPGLVVVEPRILRDDRGYFLETYSTERYRNAGIQEDFVQDNLSFSERGVLRGLHYQYPHSQGKLVQVVAGEVFDVVVDIRAGSPTFGRWVGERLSDKNHRQMYIPPGFAHGFCVLSGQALFSYKCTDYYSPDTEGGVIWSDPDIKIAWPVDMPVVSAKDAAYPRLKDIERDRLPRYEGDK